MSMSTPLRYRRHHAPRPHHAAIPPSIPPPPAPSTAEPPALYAFSGSRAPHTPPIGSQSPASMLKASPASPESTGSPRSGALRAARNFDRAERAARARGKIVDPSALNLMHHTSAGTDSPAASPPGSRHRGGPVVGPEALAEMLAKTPSPARHTHAHSLSISDEMGDKTPVVVRLPSRRVTKHVPRELTAAELAHALVKEHRLEFNFEDNTVGEDDEIIIWECVDSTRRPLRANEKIYNVVKRWDPRGRSYLRTTSTSLRNDVDSLASLVPRRDMLRHAPELEAAAVHFSRPSVMFNPHQDDSGAPYSGSPRSRQEQPHDAPGFDSLRRVPSKLSPNDLKLSVRRNHTDNDDVPLHSRLVWGFGALTLQRGRIEVKQKPGDELVCSMDIGHTDVYEWPHNGPKKYVVVLRSQSPRSRAVYVCTDSARVFSVLRNAVFTARTKTLMRS